jgi:hypothetical protein
MTIAEVVFDDVVLVAIPPAGQRGVTVQEPPAALPEGAAARFRAEDALLARPTHHRRVASVAPVGEIESPANC